MRITNQKTIAFLVEGDCMSEKENITMLVYNFITRDIEVYSNNVRIGLYNLLPKRMERLEQLVNTLGE